MPIENKSPRRSILCSGLVSYSVLEIQAFLMDMVIIMPAICLL